MLSRFEQLQRVGHVTLNVRKFHEVRKTVSGIERPATQFSIELDRARRSSRPVFRGTLGDKCRNVSASLKQALVISGQSGSAQWSDDGNSLTITPNSVRSSDIARSVIAGKPVSGYDLPSEVINAAQNFYSDLGLTTLSEFESGIKNANYTYNGVYQFEEGVINQYLSGDIVTGKQIGRAHV